MHHRLFSATPVLIGIGTVLLLTSMIPVVRQKRLEVASRLLAIRDQQAVAFMTVAGDLRAALFEQMGKDTRVLQLEERNRELSVQLARQQQELARMHSQATAAAAQRVSIVDETSIATLSYAQGEWIVITPDDTPRHLLGQLVLLDDIVLGTLSSSRSGFAPVELVAERSTGMLVSHVSTGARGMLRMEAGSLQVQFLEKIAQVRPGDLLQSVPDGVSSRGSYLVASVATSDTDLWAGGTTVAVRLLASPRIGQTVSIIRTPKAL